MCWRSRTTCIRRRELFLPRGQSHLGITLTDVAPGDLAAVGAANPFAVMLQYPGTTGALRDLSEEITAAHEVGALVIVATDLLALALLTPPGEMGADIVVGSAQRFGVPMGFGGPHAGFFATRDAFKRAMPGRLVGVSLDAAGAAGHAPGAADARAAHPPREGDLQHLHRPGAAGGDRRVLCRLARTGGPAPHRPPRVVAGAHAGRLRPTRRAAPAARRRSSTRSSSRAPMRPDRARRRSRLQPAPRR